MPPCQSHALGPPKPHVFFITSFHFLSNIANYRDFLPLIFSFDCQNSFCHTYIRVSCHLHDHFSRCLFPVSIPLLLIDLYPSPFSTSTVYVFLLIIKSYIVFLPGWRPEPLPKLFRNCHDQCPRGCQVSRSIKVQNSQCHG